MENKLTFYDNKTQAISQNFTAGMLWTTTGIAMS